MQSAFISRKTASVRVDTENKKLQLITYFLQSKYLWKQTKLLHEQSMCVYSNLPCSRLCRYLVAEVSHWRDRLKTMHKNKNYHQIQCAMNTVAMLTKGCVLGACLCSIKGLTLALLFHYRWTPQVSEDGSSPTQTFAPGRAAAGTCQEELSHCKIFESLILKLMYGRTQINIHLSGLNWSIRHNSKQCFAEICYTYLSVLTTMRSPWSTKKHNASLPRVPLNRDSTAALHQLLRAG